jgi:phosphatidylglycerophosphatase A
MNQFALFVASFGYVGFFPIAPGTAGSLAALALFAFVRWVGVPAFELGMIVAVLVIGVWSANGAERALGRKDPGPVVIDEVLGMLITLALLPVSMAGVILGFLLFRLFDVVKPYPAGRLEHLPGGYGIMLDDAMAGVYSYLVLRACMWWMPSWLIA